MTDAIKLLNAEFTRRKMKNPSYSLRAFARNLNLSPAQLSQLLSGKRNFNPQNLKVIAKGLNLSPEEERNLLTQSILDESIVDTKKRLLEEDEFRLISDWYHFAILSLSKIRGAKANQFWIADRLGISSSEAGQALERLRRMAIIEDGKVLKQKAPPLSVVSQIPSRAIQTYHHQILNMASEKLSHLPLEKRDFSAITFAADPEKIEGARKKIEKFQDQLADYLQTPNSKEVFILSCQLFPLERISK